MKSIYNIVKIIVLISAIFTLVACGDDEPLPYIVDIVGGPIDWTNDREDGNVFISVTVFDDKGVPATGGNVVFTLNDSARASFDPNTSLKYFSVDIEDSDVVEALIYATKAPETVTVRAHIPGYPVDKAVSKNVAVINDTVEADFRYTALGNQFIEFFDLSGYVDENVLPTYSWTFREHAIPPAVIGTGAIVGTSTERDPVFTFAAAGDYDVTLAVTVGAITDTLTSVIVVQ